MTVDHPANSRRATLVAAALLLAATVYYAGSLDRYGYWLDEVSTMQSLEMSFGGMVHRRISVGHQPLYFATGWVVSRVFGFGEVAQRLLPMLCVLGACVLFYDIVRRRVGPWQAVAVLAVLLCNASLHYIGHVARPYALLSLLVAGIAWLLMREAAGRRCRFVSIAICTCLALLTHYTATVAIGAFALFLLLRRRPRWSELAAIATGVAVWLPWMGYCLTVIEPVEKNLWWLPPANWPSAATAITRFTLNVYLHELTVLYPSARAALHIAPAVIALLVVYGAVRGGETGRMLLWLWVGPMAMGLYAVVTGGNKDLFSTERYFVAAILAQSTLVTLAVLDPPRRIAAARYAAGPLLVAVVVAGFAVAMSSPKHPYSTREMARHVERHIGPNELAVAVYTNQVFDWYHDGEYAVLLDSEGLANPNVPVMPMPDALLTDASGGVWIVFNHEDWQRLKTGRLEEMVADQLAALQLRFPNQRVIDFPHGKLLHLRADAGR